MEKTVEFYYDVIQYFKLNYLNIGFVLLFVVVGFLIAGFTKRRIKRRISKKSSNPITATFISQIISFALKTIVVLITLYLLGLNSFTNKILAGAGLLTFVIGFALKDTINIRVMFWVDTFKTTNRSVHHSIRSKVMNDVVAALIANGISLPAPVIELKYNCGLIIRLNKFADKTSYPSDWSKAMTNKLLDIEREVFLSGYQKVFLLNQTCCSLCKECSHNRLDCKDKARSRPSPESFAVDVYQTVRNAGLEINVVSKNPAEMNRIAILLIE